MPSYIVLYPGIYLYSLVSYRILEYQDEYYSSSLFITLFE